MPDNRLTLTIEAQNLAQAAFKQFQTDVRQSNEALQKTGQAGRQGSGGIKVYRDELGRFHDAVTGRYVSAARLLKEGFIDIDRAARKTAPATDIVTKSVRTLSESMDRHLNVSATRAGRALGDAFINAPGIIARSVLPIQQVGRSVARLSDRFIGLYRNSAVVQRIGSDFRSLQKDIRVTAGVVQQFSQRLTAQTQSIIQEAAQIERLKLGLQTLSPSIQESEAQYRRLIEVARLPGIDFSNALRASLQLQAIGKSGEEATRILIAFGNSLALSGASTADIQRTIYGLRQLIADGKVYQRELNLITSRVPVATPILQRRFGGVRADDIRSHFESIGVDESQQASEFIKILTEELEKLPRSSETAANALENLDDTFRRVQGAIGENLLPAVKETTAAIEALLFSVEGDEGLKTSIADWLSFATAMGTVTAGAVGVAASIPLLAGLANPIGLTALAVGALAGAFVKAEVEAARFRAEYNRIQEALSGSLLIGRGTDTVAIQKQIERLEARRTALQAQIRSAEGKAQADSEGQPLLRRGEPNPLRRTREQILAASDAYKTYQSQLFQVDKAIEVLTRRNNKLGDAATDAADAQVDSVSRLLRENLTKSIADLKEELQEEVVFEGVSRDLLGSEVDFQKSATALADIEVLLKLNIDAYGKLENAAASGNQEAVKGLSAVNKELNTLRDAAADRHIDNLSAAFENLIKTTDPSRKQLEAILKSADAFVQTFQGGADVVQDDVTRALGLISQVREQLQALSGDELRLETHDIGAQGLTEALLRFDDLQSTVQEDAGIDAQRSAEKQATAYIKAYRDSVDPAILNVVESVKVLRTELRGSIQDLEALNLRDKFTLEFQGEIGGERSDALAELFDLNQAVQDGIRENEIANLRKRSLALREKLDDDTLSLQQYQTDVIAILRSVYEAERAFQAVDVREDLNKRQAENARKLSQTILALEDTTKEGQIERILDTAQERQRVLAGSEGALKVIYDRFVQLEQDSQDKLAGIILGGRVADARKELTRFEERALDASSQRQRENLIRETAQFVDAYAERGDAFRDLVADAQDLGSELQQAFDLTEQQARLEDFRDGVADVINDLASVAVDHIFDGFFGAADEATAAIQVFTDVFRGDIELLENDVTRLARQVEDSRIRLSRLGEDESRRIRQLERQRRSLLARSSTGNQRDAERTRQRAQDISFRISALREDFDVRRSRTQEDADRRRNRGIDDATQRRERSQSEQTSLVGDIGQTLETAMKNALAAQLSGYLTKTAFDVGVGLITAGLGALGIGDLLKGFLGGGDGDGDGTGTPTTPQTPAQTPDTPEAQQEGDADVDGTIKTLTVDPDLATVTVDVAGIIKSAMQAAAEAYTTPSVDAAGLIKSAMQATDGYTIPSIDAKGRITSAELSEGASLPSVPGLKAGIDRVVLQMNASLPLVPGLTGEIDSLSITETLEDLPSAPGLEGRIDALTLSTEATAGLSANVAGIINALTLEGTLPAVTGLTGTIDDILVSPDIDLPSIEGLHGIIQSVGTNFDAPQVNVEGVVASLSLQATAPTLAGLNATIADVTLSTDLDTPTVTGLDGRIDSISLDPDIDLPTIRIAATAVVGNVTGGQGGEVGIRGSDEDPENPPLDGVINATLHKLFDEPIVLQGRIDATVNYLTGAGVPGDGGGGDGGGGGGAEDPVQRSALAQDISTIARTIENAVVSSGNLDPSLGPTPIVDIPSILDKLNEQTNFSDDQAQRENPGFGDILRSVNQFRQEAGGSSGAAQAGSLRVTFPAEQFQQLAQETTLQAGLIFVNESLSSIAGKDFATEATLDRIATATERTADAPLVQQLVDAGVAFPNDPTDPVNAIFTESPIHDFLGQGGLSLFAGFDAIKQNLETLQGAGDAPNLMQIGSAENPGFHSVLNFPETQKVEVTNPVKIEGGKIDANVTNEVAVKHVGSIAVSQSGEWVMQLAGGGTIPVYVTGGQLVADISGGLEGLAVALSDEEIRLSAVGAI